MSRQKNSCPLVVYLLIEVAVSNHLVGTHDVVRGPQLEQLHKVEGILKECFFGQVVSGRHGRKQPIALCPPKTVRTIVGRSGIQQKHLFVTVARPEGVALKIQRDPVGLLIALGLVRLTVVQQ